MIDGHIYLDYDTVSDVLGGRFYWDEANQKMLYSTPSEVISISPDSNTYTAGGKEKTEETFHKFGGFDKAFQVVFLRGKS